MYLYSIPETTLIIYGIGIERCVLYKCNADRWSCTCFIGMEFGVGDLLLRYAFFLFCLNKQTNRISLKGNPQRTPKNKEHMGSLTLLEAY